jgi:hypothetical protein
MARRTAITSGRASDKQQNMEAQALVTFTLVDEKPKLMVALCMTESWLLLAIISDPDPADHYCHVDQSMPFCPANPRTVAVA